MKEKEDLAGEGLLLTSTYQAQPDDELVDGDTDIFGKEDDYYIRLV